MPSKSVKQQHLFQAAEHGANFPMAKKVRESMTHDQMHDFAVGSEKGKPEHKPKHELHGRGATSKHAPFGRKPNPRRGY